MKWTRIAVAALILAAMLLTSGCSLLAEVIGGLMEDGDGGGDMPKFSKIAYQRPDLDVLTAKFEELIADLEGEKLSAEQGVSRLEEVYSAYNDFYTLDVVAELRYYHDVTDSFYADECDWFLENEPAVDQLFEELCWASANCSIAQELDEKFWGGWVVDAYGGEEESASMDPKYLELAQRENAILTEYRRAMADPTVTWRGKEYSYWDLEQDDSIS